MQLSRDFDKAMKILRRTLREQKPQKFSSSWIATTLPSFYWYMRRSGRKKDGTIDWEKIVQTLTVSGKRRWHRYGVRNIRIYEKPSEVAGVLLRFQKHLYVVFTALTETDKEIRARIIMALVRVSKRGNICAQDELAKWLLYITNDWIDRHRELYRLQGYPDDVMKCIHRCIRLYKGQGSFLHYLFKSLEYAARGKPPLVSLNDSLGEGTKSRIDYVILEEDNYSEEGEIHFE